MNRTILCSASRAVLWAIWSQLRGVINHPGQPYTFGDHEHGQALRETAKAIDAAVDGAVAYDDHAFQCARARAHEDIRKEDSDASKENPRYSAPRNLVICEGGVAFLRDLSKRLYTEDRVTIEEAERFAGHLYAVVEGQSVRLKGDGEPDYNIVYDSFAFRDTEYELVAVVPGQPLIYRMDAVSWRPFLSALDRGDVCEIDEDFYSYWLEVLPPKLWRQTVEMVDGRHQRIAFGAAEGNGVPIDGYWSDGARYFAQRTKVRTRG